MVHIINGLDSNLLFDAKTTFASQKKHINKKLLPAIKSAMNSSLVAYDSEIVNIIRQLHKSRRGIWKVQAGGRINEHNKRQHKNSRRDQV